MRFALLAFTGLLFLVLGGCRTEPYEYAAVSDDGGEGDQGPLPDILESPDGGPIVDAADDIVFTLDLPPPLPDAPPGGDLPPRPDIANPFDFTSDDGPPPPPLDLPPRDDFPPPGDGAPALDFPPSGDIAPTDDLPPLVDSGPSDDLPDFSNVPDGPVPPDIVLSPDLAVACAAGHYNGPFTGAINGFAVNGTFDFTLGPALNGVLPVIAGTMIGTGPFNSTLNAMLGGSLDCTTRIFNGTINNGVLRAFNQTFPYAGTMFALYDTMAKAFTQGTWLIKTTSGPNFVGNGTWSAM